MDSDIRWAVIGVIEEEPTKFSELVSLLNVEPSKLSNIVRDMRNRGEVVLRDDHKLEAGNIVPDEENLSESLPEPKYEKPKSIYVIDDETAREQVKHLPKENNLENDILEVLEASEVRMTSKEVARKIFADSADSNLNRVRGGLKMLSYDDIVHMDGSGYYFLVKNPKPHPFASKKKRKPSIIKEEPAKNLLDEELASLKFGVVENRDTKLKVLKALAQVVPQETRNVINSIIKDIGGK